jgi:hypothetical protein
MSSRLAPNLGPAAAAAGLAARGPFWAWAGVACMLALSLLSIVNLARLEFGPWRDEAIAIDELYFSACAVRGLAVGQLPVAGCHDNKPPMVLLVHQLVQGAGTGYDPLAIKRAAFAVTALVAGLAAMLAYRLGGGLAALAAAALALQALAAEAVYLALKTETVGLVFVLAGLLLLLPGRRGDSSWWRWASGVFFGLAVLTKQTHLLVAPIVLAWLALSLQGAPTGWLRAFMKEAASFMVGLLAPFVALAAMFFASDRHVEFIASFFVYPSVYGAPIEPGTSALELLAWKVGAVLNIMAQTPLLVLLFVASAVSLGQAAAGRRARSSSAGLARLLVLWVALALLAAALLAPVFYAYHSVPVRVFMAVTGGVFIADASARLHAWSPRALPAFVAALVAAAVLSAGSSWKTNGGKDRMPPARDPMSRVDDGQGRFGYVLGMWPDFYVHNGLVPASNVMYPWALVGAPANNFYELPEPSSLRGRMLGWAREHGSRQLMADFRRSPPRYIVVVDAMARVPGSPRIADVPGFDEYLKDHCDPVHEVEAGNQGPASLFRCRTDGR